MKPSRNASIQVRATSHKKWIHVGCTDPGNRALTDDKLEQLLRRASEALDFVQAHMEKIELVASVWRVIRKFHPKLVSEEEWDNLKTLGENVDAW